MAAHMVTAARCELDCEFVTDARRLVGQPEP